MPSNPSDDTPDLPPLFDVSTEALVAELLGRFDFGCVTLCRDMPKDPSKYQVIMRTKGGNLFVKALIDDALETIRESATAERRRNSRSPDDGDDTPTKELN